MQERKTGKRVDDDEVVFAVVLEVICCQVIAGELWWRLLKKRRLGRRRGCRCTRYASFYVCLDVFAVSGPIQDLASFGTHASDTWVTQVEKFESFVSNSCRDTHSVVVQDKEWPCHPKTITQRPVLAGTGHVYRRLTPPTVAVLLA
jgi:hypothetical protein